MSHFTVLVVGDNPKDQLEPFSENADKTPVNGSIKFWTDTIANLKDAEDSLWKDADILIDRRIDSNDVSTRRELQAEIDQLTLAASIVGEYASKAYANRETAYLVQNTTHKTDEIAGEYISGKVALCQHLHTEVSTTGGTYLSGDVWDNIKESVYCLDCNTDITPINIDGEMPL